MIGIHRWVLTKRYVINNVLKCIEKLCILLVIRYLRAVCHYTQFIVSHEQKIYHFSTNAYYMTYIDGLGEYVFKSS